MRYKRQSEAQKEFAEEVREMEVRLLHKQLDENDASRMKSKRYSWHYRPSHHIQTGLLTMNDISILQKPDKRLLSIGAFPGYFEQVLCALGVPSDHILLADNDPDIMRHSGAILAVEFDAAACWPEIGTFDLIIFPESLCMCVASAMKQGGQDVHAPKDAAFATDALESEILCTIIGQALKRLRPHGEIRANGPMSHPNVVKAMSARLLKKRILHHVEYERFFLTIRTTAN